MLNCEENRKAVAVLKQVVRTMRGSSGKFKLIQNNCSGPVTITSSSIRLLSSMRVSNPLIKLVTSAALYHLKEYQDGGLLVLLLSVEFLDGFFKLEVPQCQIAKVYHALNRALISHLDECSLRIKVDFSNINVTMSLLRTILKTKPVCGLSEAHEKYLACLLLRIFLNMLPTPESCPSSLFGNYHVVSACGLSPHESQVVPGFLHPLVDEGSGNTSVSKAGSVKCVLFHVSLSGDFDTQLNDAKWHCSDEVDPMRINVQHILTLCERLLSEGIGAVACQKVIHPTVKKYLWDRQVLVLERLGHVAFMALTTLTGATPIENCMTPFDLNCCGKLDTISVLTLHNKMYYHLQNEKALVYTLFLCNYQEEGVEELKTVCQQGIEGLRRLLNCPFGYCGGGCLETHLAAFIRHWGSCNIEEMVKSGATRGHIMAVTKTYAKCLETVAMTLHQAEDLLMVVDGGSHHLWTTTNAESNPRVPDSLERCACGLLAATDIKSEGIRWDVLFLGDSSFGSALYDWHESPIGESQFCANGTLVIDPAASKLNAFKVALEVVHSILSVDTIIAK